MSNHQRLPASNLFALCNQVRVWRSHRQGVIHATTEISLALERRVGLPHTEISLLFLSCGTRSFSVSETQYKAFDIKLNGTPTVVERPVGQPPRSVLARERGHMTSIVDFESVKHYI